MPRKPELARAAAAAAEPAEAPHGLALDRYDIAILHELQADARLSNAELASRIGLSAAPTWRRVRWLEQQGYITGYRAEIDRRKVGLGVLQVVATDLDAYARWSMEALFKLPNVKDLHTSFSLGEVKAGGALPLGHLTPSA